MPSNDLNSCEAIEGFLSAYALDALEESEAALVEGHLSAGGGCPRCLHSLVEFQRIAASLGESVSHRTPPLWL